MRRLMNCRTDIRVDCIASASEKNKKLQQVFTPKQEVKREQPPRPKPAVSFDDILFSCFLLLLKLSSSS